MEFIFYSWLILLFGSFVWVYKKNKKKSVGVWESVWGVWVCVNCVVGVGGCVGYWRMCGAGVWVLSTLGSFYSSILLLGYVKKTVWDMWDVWESVWGRVGGFFRVL
jgi:hypothetical protein